MIGGSWVCRRGLAVVYTDGNANFSWSIGEKHWEKTRKSVQAPEVEKSLRIETVDETIPKEGKRDVS